MAVGTTPPTGTPLTIASGSDVLTVGNTAGAWLLNIPAYSYGYNFLVTAGDGGAGGQQCIVTPIQNLCALTYIYGVAAAWTNPTWGALTTGNLVRVNWITIGA